MSTLSTDTTTTRAATHGSSVPQQPQGCQPEGTSQPWLAAEAARQALASTWHLAVLEGPDAGLVLPVSTTTVVGRGHVLSDPLVSRNHLRLRARSERVHAQDLGSVNGSRRRLPGGVWWPLRGDQRIGEGTRLRLGASVLELRRRPADLLVPSPSGPGGTGWGLTTGMLCLLAAVAMVVVTVAGATGAVRAGHRGSLGVVATSPVVLMMVLRALLAIRSRRDHRQPPPGVRGPGRPGALRHRPGWRGRRPDPATMLLALAAQSYRPAPSAAQTTLAASPHPSADRAQGLQAWTGRRGRRQILRLDPGDYLAVTGTHAQACLRWWCAQVVARSQARMALTGSGARLSWGPVGSRLSATIAACPPAAVPPQALSVRAVSSRAPHVAAAWWLAVCVLSGAEPLEQDTGTSSTPDAVSLADVVTQVDATELREAWARQEQGHEPGGKEPGLSAVLGVGAHGPVRADLVSQGPHALLAGTTGAGKSELLVSWLLQLALGTSPSRLAMVLVDYKGGAAFGPLTGLAHTVGVLTDLDPAGTQRALSSLQAEVRRRERLLSTYAAKDMASLPAHVTVPRLVIAVDEFATLAAEHPDVLESLVRVAAQGRSLGIHLILATQRPQGAVSPAIRANTSVRVCLRVLDPADSRDVLGHDGAAHLPRHPGRVIVCGADEEAACQPGTRPRAAGDGLPPRDPLDGQGRTERGTAGGSVLQAPWSGNEQQVQAVVDLIADAARGSRPPWRPWAEPLPTRVDRDQAAALVSRQTGCTDEATSGTPTAPGGAPPPRSGVLLGVTDVPERQALDLWYWDPRSTLLVVGSPGSGRTTTLVSAATGALDAGTPVHLCTSGSPLPGRLPLPDGAGAAHSLPRRRSQDPEDGIGTGIGTVVGTEDPRRLARLWSLAVSGALGGSLLCLDDVDSLVRAVDEVLGPGEGQGLLEAIIRSAPGTRTRVALTAPLAWASCRWASTTSLRLVLGASRSDQASQAGLPRGVLTGSGPGRGVLVDRGTTLACQVVLPTGERRRHGSSTHAHGAGRRRATGSPLRLEPLPRLVPPTSVPPGTWAVGGDSASPVPLAPGTSVLVVGPPGSGRSTALAALREAAGEQVSVCDDLDLASPARTAVVDAALEQGATVLASATTDRAASTYRGALSTLRERGALLVLWPGIGPAHQVAGMPLRPATDPRALTLPGRGVLVHHGTSTPLQVVARPLHATCEDDDTMSTQVSPLTSCPAATGM